MPAKNADTTAALQAELAIGQLDSLSTLPCVAVQFYPKLTQNHFSPAQLADIIESDPALTAKILSLSFKHNIISPDEKVSLRHILDKIPVDEVHNAVLSIKVLPVFDPDDTEGQRIQTRKGLLLHSLAVACCAKEIAEMTLPQVDPHTAYIAGLLHDIGKFAIEETMPKSFARVIEQARSAKSCSCDIEKQYLGADHTIFGKHLSEKWHLPSQIVFAIWLHHSDTAAISWHIPQVRIAQLIHSANSIARQAGIGQSGSFDSPEPIDKVAQSLGIDPEQLKQIQQNLPETVAEKSKILGLDVSNAAARYCEMAQTAAIQFACKQMDLSLKNRQLQTVSSHFDFIMDFLLSINSNATAINIAENFATRWQRFYQTGTVCLYLAPPDVQQFLEAIIVQSLGQNKRILLETPEDSKPIPETIATSFAILDAHEHVDWLFEQLDVDFDERHTKLVPLLSGGRAVGAIIFELHWPVQSGDIEENFRTLTSIAGSILDSALKRQKTEHLAERFAQLISGPISPGPLKPKSPQAETITEISLNALVEMSAGIAHELNNPLAVISGRAQLLADAETNQKKKQTLRQIHENARQASSVVEDLMVFAEPPPPRTTHTDIKQILDEAVQLASQKANVESIKVQVEITEGIKDVFVDSAQIASAIANIICNSLESYTDRIGPINITADTDEGDELVRLQISDQGCGMDAETLRKATQPFFSAKPAGRKRGMGLAYANRLIHLNKGTLQIASQPGSGTTVTITLPCK
jgi:putative nucleotidyltransferase with HDIG domain